MDTLLAISIIFFSISIIVFCIRNGRSKLTLKQIITLSGYQIKKRKPPHMIIFSTFSELMLVFSIITLIIYLDYLPTLVLFIGGLVVYILQKIIILLVLNLRYLRNN